MPQLTKSRANPESTPARWTGVVTARPILFAPNSLDEIPTNVIWEQVRPSSRGRAILYVEPWPQVNLGNTRYAQSVEAGSLSKHFLEAAEKLRALKAVLTYADDPFAYNSLPYERTQTINVILDVLPELPIHPFSDE